MWTKHDRYGPTVVNGWAGGVQNLEDFHSSLGQMQKTLQDWSREEFGSAKQQLRTMRSRLEKIRAESLNSGPTKEECDLMKRISDLLAREETMMKQRSRVQCLKEGDRNTAFFMPGRRSEQKQIKFSLVRKMMVALPCPKKRWRVCL
jgi:exonuclease VII large subunit